MTAERKPGERPALTEITPLTPERSAGSTTKALALELRKARKRRLIKRLLIFVLAPTAVAAVYFYALASDQYESYALFTVQSSEMRPTLGMEGLLAGLGSGGGGHDVLTVRDYLLSRDMLTRLNKEQGFLQHYEDPRADFISRLRHNASFEEAYGYFGHKITADLDQTSGAITLRVRAFSPDKAVKLSTAILAYSEEMVNKLSDRERRDRTTYADAALKKAEQRLIAARQQLITQQQKHEDFNPLQTATAAMSLRTQMEGELAKARAELMQLKSFMNEEAPQVRAMNERVKALSAQVAGENRRLVDPKKPDGLGQSLVDFEGAMVEKEFAQKAYESLMAAAEMSHADADRQHRYVTIIATPSKPDEPGYPHRFRSVLTALVVSFLFFGVGSLAAAAVREHARL